MALNNTLSVVSSSYYDLDTLSKGLGYTDSLMGALEAAVVCVMVVARYAGVMNVQ